MLNGGRVANAWQPMSAATCVSPSSRCAILSALNTGRSGQPVQKAGGRFGSGARSSSWPRPTCAVSAARRVAASPPRKRASAPSTTSGTYSPCAATMSLPWMRDARPVVVGQRLQLLLDEVRHPLFEDEHARLALEESQELLGHERMDDVQHRAWARGSRRARRPSRAARARGAPSASRPALQDDAELLLLAGNHLVQAALDDEPPRGGQPPLELLRLLRVRRRRVAEPPIVERRPREAVEHADASAARCPCTPCSRAGAPRGSAG